MPVGVKRPARARENAGLHSRTGETLTDTPVLGAGQASVTRSAIVQPGSYGTGIDLKIKTGTRRGLH